MSELATGREARTSNAPSTTAATSSADAMRPAKAPVGVSKVAIAAVVLALLITALGVVAIRDALVAAGALSGEGWLSKAVMQVDGVTPGLWLLPAAAALVLVGLWLVLTALRPRRRTGVALRADTGVYLRPRDISRLSTSAAEGVDGVLDASASATTRSVSVRVTTTGDVETDQKVRDAVADRLRHLDPVPGVRVRSRTEGRPTEDGR